MNYPLAYTIIFISARCHFIFCFIDMFLSFWAHTDEAKPRTKLLEEILNHLGQDDVRRVVLHENHGVGKTWMAKEVVKHAISKGIFNGVIWLNYFISDHGGLLRIENEEDCIYFLHGIMVHQLSLQQDIITVDHVKYCLDDNGKFQKLYILVDLLKQKLEKGKYLLVLDGALEKTKTLIEVIDQILDLGNKSLSKVIITTTEANNNMMMSCNDPNKRAVAVEIKALNVSESKDILQKSWNNNHIGYLCDNDVEEILKRCKNLPAAIVFTGNVLLYALENAPDDLGRKLAVKEAMKEVNDYWMLGCCSGYSKFEDNITILRCFLHSALYFRKHGSMKYNELILLWMLEGYFVLDNITSLEEVYTQGHIVLTDLLDAGLLGEREVGDVVLETAGLNFSRYLYSMLCEKYLFEPIHEYSRFIGRRYILKRIKGCIAAYKDSGKEKIKLLTLLVQGNSISREDQFKINDPYVLESTRILSFSHVEPIISLQMCPSLLVLILRDCHSINHIKVSDIANLEKLRVLQISGCSFLEKIPEDFLAKFDDLETLNLSSTPIAYIPRPSSRSALRHLRSLILRRCTQLETFPNVNGLENLKVLDLSGAMFKSLDDEAWYSELEGLPYLTILDLSETNIYNIPGLTNLGNLTCLLLKKCPQLNKLTPLTALTNLQLIDVSGSTKLDNFREINLPNGDCLRKLDLSNTMIRTIPALKNASNLVYLYLKGCCQLKELAPIENAKKLRVLDVSDAIQLKKINASFQEMESLQELYLSNTKIKTLPPLSGLKCLRKLVLRGCESLQQLPEMERLFNLLLVDLQGCNALETLLDNGQFSDVTILKS